MRMRHKQSGATLVVSLIMLVVLTLLVVSAMRSSNTSLRVVGNMQLKTEAAAATQQAIEQVISTDFVTNPVAQNITVNVGTASYSVDAAKPTCTSTRPVTNDELNVQTNPLDQYCLNGNPNAIQIESSDGVNVNKSPSACSAQQWHVEATATDANTGSTVTLNQGVARRVEIGTSC
jgi:Tfp pilus assembly protein PilX